ncbi:hypothetical protein WJ45_19985 [Burkholderia ubonensis]|nr:hypothetical protein WJ45_19985 [Burkholderia ubonensis]KVQ44334.1 hypothetical protein WK04_15490 [Burkholderia ubonensis]
MNGFCSACAAWLGAKRSGRPRPPNAAIPDDQTWAAATFADLLLRPLLENRATYHARVADATDAVCKQAFDGDAAALCQHLGIRTSDVSSWRNARSHPNARTLLALSYCFQINLRALFDGPCDWAMTGAPRASPYKKALKRNRLRSSAEWDEIGRLLQQFIAGQRQAASLASVAGILGVRPGQLREHFPAACIAVSRIARRFRAQARADARLIRDGLLCECISAEVRRMRRLGQQPTIRHLHAFARARQLASNTHQDLRRISEIRHATLRDAPCPTRAPRQDGSTRR